MKIGEVSKLNYVEKRGLMPNQTATVNAIQDNFNPALGGGSAGTGKKLGLAGAALAVLLSGCDTPGSYEFPNELQVKFNETVIKGMGITNYSNDMIPTFSYTDLAGNHITKYWIKQNDDEIIFRVVGGATPYEERYYMGNNGKLMCDKSGDFGKITFKVETGDGYAKYIDLQGKCHIAYKKEHLGTIGTYTEDVMGRMNKIGNLSNYRLNNHLIASVLDQAQKMGIIKLPDLAAGAKKAANGFMRMA